MELAGARVNERWLSEARRLADDYDRPSASGAAARDSRCFCCGGAVDACGGYKAPGYACGKAVQNACPERGCTIKHMQRGARAWSCKQAAAARTVLSADQLQSAFGHSYTAFVGGSHAKAAAVKAAAGTA